MTAAVTHIYREEQMYGPFPVGGDPRRFSPDPECSTEEERACHRRMCDALDRGENPHMIAPTCGAGSAIYAFGLGTYTFTVSAEEWEAMNAPYDGPEEMDPDAPF